MTTGIQDMPAKQRSQRPLTTKELSESVGRMQRQTNLKRIVEPMCSRPSISQRLKDSNLSNTLGKAKGKKPKLNRGDFARVSSKSRILNLSEPQRRNLSPQGRLAETWQNLTQKENVFPYLKVDNKQLLVEQVQVIVSFRVETIEHRYPDLLNIKV